MAVLNYYASSLIKVVRPLGYDDEPASQEEFCSELAYSTHSGTMTIEGFRCKKADFNIICNISPSNDCTVVETGDYYLSRDDEGRLYIIRVANGHEVQIMDYSREILDKLTCRLRERTTSIKDAFIRENDNRIYIVYQCSDSVECDILETIPEPPQMIQDGDYFDIQFSSESDHWL